MCMFQPKRKVTILAAVYALLLSTVAIGDVTLENDVLVMDYTSEPDPVWGKGKLWSEMISGRTEVRVQDSSGNDTTISPHRFDLYEPPPDAPLPWTYYSENRFIGKRVNVDMSGALRALESLSGQQFVYLEDLPASRTLDHEAWEASQNQKLVERVKAAEIEMNPWVEIAFSEAWEEVDEMAVGSVLTTATRYRINWETKAVESYVAEETVTIDVPTGQKTSRLKEGILFDETTGKCYRPRTPEDVSIDPNDLPVIGLPQYVLDRLPTAP